MPLFCLPEGAQEELQVWVRLAPVHLVLQLQVMLVLEAL